MSRGGNHDGSSTRNSPAAQESDGDSDCGSKKGMACGSATGDRADERLAKYAVGGDASKGLVGEYEDREDSDDGWKGLSVRM